MTFRWSIADHLSLRSALSGINLLRENGDIYTSAAFIASLKGSS